MINGFEWPIGWRPLVEGETADSFEAELRREVSTDHVLHGEPVSLIARRDDCDDYLFALKGARLRRSTSLGAKSIRPSGPQSKSFLTLRLGAAPSVDAKSVGFQRTIGAT